MYVGELCHGMTNALVDRPGNLAPHGMSNRNIHVGGCQRRRHGFEAVAHGQHDVGLDTIEHARQFDQAEPRRFRHGGGRLTFDQHMNARDRGEAVAFDQIDNAAVPVKNRRGADHKRQFEVRVFSDRTHRRFDARIIGARADDDADFSHLVKLQ